MTLLLQSPHRPRRPDLSIRTLLLGGALVLVGGVGAMGTWAALAPLHSAVVAPGVLEPESGRKTVRHSEGGVITEIDIKEGDAVKAGAVLIRLDPTEAKARLDMLTADWLGQLAIEARLEAEFQGQPAIHWPAALQQPALPPGVTKVIADQRSLFAVRTSQFGRLLEQLNAQAASSQDQAQSLDEQRRYLAAELDVLRQQLAVTQKLTAAGNAPRTQLLEQLKEQARLQASESELSGRIAQARQQAADAEAKIASERSQRQEQVLTQLNDARTQIANLSEQRRDAANRLANRTIRASEDSLVVGMHPLAVGMVIAPNEPIFDLVPAGEPLLVAAHIQPQDIEAVRPGRPTRLILSAYDTRVIGTIAGTVVDVSADRMVDPDTRQPYFLARVRLKDATPSLVHNLRIVPGMPVEVQIEIAPRTPLDYLIAPITRSYDKAFIQQH